MASVDWIKIKNEYVNSNISYKDLSEKYPVSKTAIANKGKAENWVKLKKNNLNKTCTKVVQKTAEKIIDAEVDRITKLLNLSDEVLKKIEIALGQLTKYVDMFGNVRECEVIDANKLRKIVASLKDAKEIMLVENNNDEDLETGVVMIPEVGNVE